MDIKADEITRIIKQRIQDYGQEVEPEEVGEVISVGDGIATVYGLQKAMAGELVYFPGDIPGIVLNLDADTVGIAVMGDDSTIKEGDQVKRSQRIAETPVGETVVGRVVDAVGNPLDGLGEISTREFRKVEIKAP